jgi:hypothetical protein
MRNPVLNDTVELVRSLWPNCSARPAGARKYYTVRPHATEPGSTPYFWGGEPEVARLLAVEATVQGMVLDAELQADHQASDDMALFNVVATHMPDAPPPHIVQQRREARQCLACGKSSSHWHFQDCPKVKAQLQLVQVLLKWIRRDRATRERAAEGRSAEGARRAGRSATGS